MGRKTYLDVAKGFAMICIFLGHLGVYNIDRVVYTFMVSVFFLISGYFLNNKRDIKTFVVDKFKRLIIPYIFVSCVIMVFAVLINEFIYDGINSKGVALQWIIAALFGTGGSDVTFMGYVVPRIGAIWFLLATFFASVGLRILLEMKPIIRVIFVLLILFISCYSTRIVFLPWSIQPAGVALFFMYVGHLWRIAEPCFDSFSKELKLFVLILAIWCWGEMIINYQWFLLVLALVGNGITDIFRSICGCYVILLLAKVLDKNQIVRKVFSFIGEYSIIFLSVHLIELTFLPKAEMKNWLIHMGLSEPISFISVVLLRFIIIMLSVTLLSKCNIIRKIFGFSKKEKNHE